MVKRDRRNQDNPVVFFDITIGGRDVGKIVFELYKDVVPKVCTLAYVIRSKKPISWSMHYNKLTFGTQHLFCIDANENRIFAWSFAWLSACKAENKR